MKHKSKSLRRLEELRLRGHAPTISRILELGHAEPRSMRNMRCVCVLIGLVINKVLDVGEV